MLQKKNSGIVVEEPVSCHQTPQSSKKGEEKKDKTNTNFNNRMKKASKKKIHIDGEEKTCHQQLQPSTKKTCPTSVKKITFGILNVIETRNRKSQ